MADNQRRKRRPGIISVLPQRVIFDRQLTASAKVLFAEIIALSETDGYCWASNEYLGKLFDLSETSISRQVAQLVERGYIECVMVPVKSGSERHIYVTDKPFQLMRNRQGESGEGVRKNEDTPLRKNEDTGLRKNEDQSIDNNKYSENTPYSPPKGTGRTKREHKDAPDWKPAEFERLWKWYPTGETPRPAPRGNKQRAIRAWEKLHPDDELIGVIAEALARQAQSEQWKDGVGIPHLSTYLNGYGWEGWEADEDG